MLSGFATRSAKAVLATFHKHVRYGVLCFLTYISFQVYSYVRFILGGGCYYGQGTMTVDLGDELRESLLNRS